MSRHYKKLIFLLIPACAGFCLALALGSAEEPSQLTQEQHNKNLVLGMLMALQSDDVNRPIQYFDPNYIHHLFSQDTPLTLDETISWFHRDVEGHSMYDLTIDNVGGIAEGDSVVVWFDRWLWYSDIPIGGSNWSSFAHLSSDVWILHITDGKLVEGWSRFEPGHKLNYNGSEASPRSDVISEEDKNKALVKEALLAFAADPNFVYWSDPPEHFNPYLFASEFWYNGGYYQWEVLLGLLYPGGFVEHPFTFKFIIAEGDMVSVCLEWKVGPSEPGDPEWPCPEYFQLGTFRIAQGKIVEFRMAPPVKYSWQDM